jgi:hypothetical protein
MVGRMHEFTESDAISRVEDIGQAFGNDLNDSDGPVLYEGIMFHEYSSGGGILVYSATLEDHSEVEFRWSATLIQKMHKKGDNEH